MDPDQTVAGAVRPTAPGGRLTRFFWHHRGWRLRSWSGVAVVVIVGTAAMLLASLLAAWTRPPLSPDSWAYLLLARSFHSTPYQIPLIRQYQFDTTFSDSFPPVWPLLLFGASALVHAGPWLGIILAALVAVALLPGLNVLLVPFVRATGRRRVAAAACWAILLSFGPYLDEILSGRSMPVAMLLYVALAVALTRAPRLTVTAGVLAGAAAGLLWMTRFDAAPIVLLVGALVPLARLPGARTRWLVGYACAAALILAPWVIYSRRVFGVTFVGDNAIVARSIAPRLVTYWFPTNQPVIADAPLAWLVRVSGNLRPLAASLWRALSRYGFASSLLAMFAAWTCVQAGNAAPRPGYRARMALLFTSALVCQLAGPAIIGAFDLRYFAPLLAAVGLWSVVLLVNAKVIRYRSMMLAPLLIGLTLGWKKSLGFQRAQRETAVAVAQPDRVDRWPDASGVSLRVLDRCLPSAARVLLVDPGVPAYLVAYYLHRTALEAPGNWGQLSDSVRAQFLFRFRVSDVVVGADSGSTPVSGTAPVPSCPPVRVVLPGPGA